MPSAPLLPPTRSRPCKFGDPLAEYRARYPGVSRGQLKQRDRPLYEQFRRQGLLGQLPRAQRLLTDPLAYFCQHYGELGLRRKELQQRDPGLYARLNRDGLLDAAIPKPPVRRPPLPRPLRKGSRVFDCR